MSDKYFRYYPKEVFYRDLENNPEYIELNKELEGYREKEESLIDEITKIYYAKKELLPEEERVQTQKKIVQRYENKLIEARKILQERQRQARPKRNHMNYIYHNTRSHLTKKLRGTQASIIDKYNKIENLKKSLYTQFAQEVRKEIQNQKIEAEVDD